GRHLAGAGVVRQRPGHAAGQPGRRAQLRVEHVGSGRGEEGVAALQVAHQGDEVGHRAAGRPHRVVRAEQRGDAVLQFTHRGVVAEDVVVDLRRDHRLTHALGRPRDGVRSQVDRAVRGRPPGTSGSHQDRSNHVGPHLWRIGSQIGHELYSYRVMSRGLRNRAGGPVRPAGVAEAEPDLVGQEFDAYFRARRDAVRRTAYLLCGDWHRADDHAQSAFVALHRHWRRIRDRDALDAWMRRTLVRTVVDETRRPWRRERSTDVTPETASEGPAEGVATRHVLVDGLRA